MRVININVNGIRAASKKGCYAWMSNAAADFVLLQEVRAKQEQIPEHLPGYHFYLHSAQKPGYSGVAIYTRHKPEKLSINSGFSTLDDEGRWLQLSYPNLEIVSLYMPSGSSGEHMQAKKDALMEAMLPLWQSIGTSAKAWIIGGDINIAHTKLDIKNWRSNQKSSGFLQHERAWLDKLFADYGLIDAFRQVNKQDGFYTWWSNRGNAYANDVGWRIDYQLTNKHLGDKVLSASIAREQRFSDHAALTMDYEFELSTQQD